MNETRNIIVGLEIGKFQSQLCYYDRKEKEPISVSIKSGSNQYFFPTLLSVNLEKKIWHYGLEAEYFSHIEGEIAVNNLMDIWEEREKAKIQGADFDAAQLMEIYLKGVLSLLGIGEPVRQIKGLMITVPKLSASMVKVVYEASKRMNFSRNQIFLQDYDESFYYYVMNHRKDNYTKKIGCFLFHNNEVSFAKLVTDNQKKPVMIHIEHGITVELSTDLSKRDEDFYEFIKQSCGKDMYSSIYIVGEGFDQEWAIRSTRLLGRNQRHIFYGNNLYVKGACYGAREKCEEESLKGYLYLSSSLVKNNVGMEMLVNGSPKLYPLVEAGKNWYEIHTKIELILDEKEDLEFVVTPMEGGDKTKFCMKLPNLLKRPNKTTRLEVSLSYENSETCVIAVKDMGFGEIFPSGGNVWTEKVSW